MDHTPASAGVLRRQLLGGKQNPNTDFGDLSSSEISEEPDEQLVHEQLAIEKERKRTDFFCGL